MSQYLLGLTTFLIVAPLKVAADLSNFPEPRLTDLSLARKPFFYVDITVCLRSEREISVRARKSIA